MNWKKESQKQKQKGKKAGKAERKTKEVGKQNKNQIKKEWGGPLGQANFMFFLHNHRKYSCSPPPHTHRPNVANRTIYPPWSKTGYLCPSTLLKRINLPLGWFWRLFEVVLSLTVLTG